MGQVGSNLTPFPFVYWQQQSNMNRDRHYISLPHDPFHASMIFQQRKMIPKEKDMVTENDLSQNNVIDDEIFSQKAPNPYDAEEIYLQSKNDKDILKNDQIISTNDYHTKSYRNFNPAEFQGKSREWLLAMLHYVIDLKMPVRKIREVSRNKVTFTDLFLCTMQFTMTYAGVLHLPRCYVTYFFVFLF